MRIRRRLVPRLVVFALAAFAASLSGWAWRHRIEIFQVPALWRTVRVLRANPSALPAVDERGLTSLDLALSRLIRLQRPGFLGGKEFQLVPLRGRGVGRAVVAICYPLDEDFEAPIGDEERPETVTFCGCDFLTALALDASGRVLGEPLGIAVWSGWLPSERYSVVPDTGGAHDVLRIATRIECGTCSYASSGLPPPARLEVSIDQNGLAVHGLVAAGDLAAPICPRKHHPFSA